MINDLTRKAYQLERFIYANEGIGVEVEKMELEVLNKKISEAETI